MFGLTRFIVLEISDHNIILTLSLVLVLKFFFVEIISGANISFGNLDKLEITYSMMQKASALEAT